MLHLAKCHVGNPWKNVLFGGDRGGIVFPKFWIIDSQGWKTAVEKVWTCSHYWEDCAGRSKGRQLRSFKGVQESCNSSVGKTLESQRIFKLYSYSVISF